MTGYVTTRWYRAPEIMLNWMHYDQTGLCPACSFYDSSNTFISKISVILLTVLREFDIGSTKNPCIDIFLHSHRLSAWF